MSAAAIVTLIGVGLLAGALVAYLSAIAYHLSKVNFTLGTVLIGVRAIARQTQPVRSVVDAIASDVAAIDTALGELVAAATAARPVVTRRSRPRASR